jgi:hypothetical protein
MWHLIRQTAEQRMEMWELRKRLTDLQEDAVHSYKGDVFYY